MVVGCWLLVASEESVSLGGGQMIDFWRITTMKKLISPAKIQVNTWCCDVPGSPDGECLTQNNKNGLI